MSVLIIFIKLIAVFDLLVIAVYFGGDILSTMLNKLRKKPKQEDPFDFSLDAATVPLSIDSIRQLYSGDAADFVEEKILPNAEKTMAVLTDQEQTAARLLLSALIGFLAAEAPMDEQSFPMVMELLNCMEGEKEDGCQDAVDILLEDTVRNTHRHEEYYSNYQRYQLMQVDKTRVILACRIIINDLLGKLYRYEQEAMRRGATLCMDKMKGPLLQDKLVEYAYRQLSGEKAPTFHKLLFVHAEDTSAGVLRAAMLQKGFDLILVSSIGEAKRRIFEDKEIELILCDLELPDGTAMELFHTLRRVAGMFQMKNPPVRLLPFFILTESNDLATEYEYRHEVVNDYITARSISQS